MCVPGGTCTDAYRDRAATAKLQAAKIKADAKHTANAKAAKLQSCHQKFSTKDYAGTILCHAVLTGWLAVFPNKANKYVRVCVSCLINSL